MDDKLQFQGSAASSAVSAKSNFGGRRLTEPEESGIVRDRDDEFHITRHVGLLLALGISMFVVRIQFCLDLLLEELDVMTTFEL